MFTRYSAERLRRTGVLVVGLVIAASDAGARAIEFSVIRPGRIDLTVHPNQPRAAPISIRRVILGIADDRSAIDSGGYPKHSLPRWTKKEPAATAISVVVRGPRVAAWALASSG